MNGASASPRLRGIRFDGIDVETRRTHARLLRLAATVVMLAGVGLLSWSAGTVVGSLVFQSRAEARLDRPLARRSPGSPAVPVPPPIVLPVSGEPWARVEIPRLRLRAVAVEGDDAALLRRAVGHVPGTAFPWEEGNVALAGHRDSFFRPLRRVKIGDLVRIVTPESVYTYRVSSTREVAPQKVAVLAATPRPTLTLITCFPFGWIGPAPERFVVQAVRVDVEARMGPERLAETARQKLGATD